MMDSSRVSRDHRQRPHHPVQPHAVPGNGRYFRRFPSVIRPLVKKSFQPTRVEMLPLAIKQAFGLLRNGRPGPGEQSTCRSTFSRNDRSRIPIPIHV